VEITRILRYLGLMVLFLYLVYSFGIEIRPIISKEVPTANSEQRLRQP
jgi:hypothetical protein